MTIERYIRLIMGLVIIIGVVLGAPVSPIYISSYFLWLCLLAGLNLIQMSFTNTCPMMMILKKYGVSEK